ncbi:MAG: hypothetical protein EXR50_02340 [Dehalococcoidia bacterium]|nr:hypothetical protein [Dehalococcoidia bacterium]
MDSIFDLHVHTLMGSRDSDLSPEQLVVEASRLVLKGVLLAEHDGWPANDFNKFSEQHELVMVNALEVYTDMGHVITLGMKRYYPGVRDIRELRRVVDEVGGFMILAHPFRFLSGPHGQFTRNQLFVDPALVPKTAYEALSHPVFELVDAIEVVNAGTDEIDNQFALEVTKLWGRPGTGGSDAHSTHGIARGATLFHGEVRNERDLLDALRAGAYTALEGYNKGQVIFYGEPPDWISPTDGTVNNLPIGKHYGL